MHRYRTKNTLYLLPFLKLQLDPGLDAIARVPVGLLQGKLHEVLMVGACQVPTDEYDHIGQDLKRWKRTLRTVRASSLWTH